MDMNGITKHVTHEGNNRYVSLTIFIPIPTPSAANTREHWRARAARTKALRATAYYAVKSQDIPTGARYRITLTRMAPRALDDDNLPPALKPARDGIADALSPTRDRGNQRARWADDSATRFTWIYEQRRPAKPREIGLCVTIAWAEPSESF